MKKKLKKVIFFSSLIIASTVIFMRVYKGYFAWTEEGDILANVEALAQVEVSASWYLIHENCVYNFKGPANKKIVILKGGEVVATGTFDRTGSFTYTIINGQIRCMAGGGVRCSAKDCPVVTSYTEPV